MKTKIASSVATLLLAFTVAPVAAQTIPDTPSARAVGIFVQSCIPFTGDAPGLRKWIADRHLTQLSDEAAAAFLGTIGGGRVFSATNASGEYALVSYDNGACRVVGEKGDLQAAEEILLSYLSHKGFAATPTITRDNSHAAQQLYSVTTKGRHWTLSVTRHDHLDAPRADSG